MGSVQAIQSEVFPRLAPSEGSPPTGEPRLGASEAPRLHLRASPEVQGPRPHPRVRRAIEAARQRVAEENTRSAGLSPDDLRLLMALRVSDALEGGRAAILRPERRRDLVANAESMGLRPFDANLIIAIVQDGARRGEHLSHDHTVSRLGFVGVVPGARRAPRAQRRPIIAIMGVTLGVAWAVWLIAWLVGAN